MCVFIAYIECMYLVTLVLMYAMRIDNTCLLRSLVATIFKGQLHEEMAPSTYLHYMDNVYFPRAPKLVLRKGGSLYVYAYDVCSWLHACDVCEEGVVYYVYGQSMNLIMCAIIPTQT